MKTEALTPEEIESLKSVGIVAENWSAVSYSENETPYAFFREEQHAIAYRDKFSATSIVAPWPMKIRDYRKGKKLNLTSILKNP
jgi:hypothetical protein